MPRSERTVLMCAALTTLVWGVGCDGEGTAPLRPEAGVAPTYHEDVAPLIARECLACHVEGGIGPFTLDSYAQLVDNAESVVAAVEAGTMPPWLPADSCHDLEGTRGLTADERGIFAAWLSGGMQEGDVADAPPPVDNPLPTFSATDIARMPEPYLPDASRPDDYRCFVLDHDFDVDTFLTGSNVIPGASALVHHVLVYAIRPDQVAMIEANDTSDEGPGYTCFGGPFGDAADAQGSLGAISLGGWVPGQIPDVEAEGRAVYVPAGSKIVMQVHYNLLAAPPEADSTEFQMTLTQEEPEFLVSSFPTAILDFNIPAGAASSEHQAVFRSYRSEPLRLIGVTPHMHLLGTEIGMRMMPASGDAPACLIDVPRWDFNWQQGYSFSRDEAVMLEPGAGLELRCAYDNSETNQPVVNGERTTPRDVTWGEGTLDEMCLMYVAYETPWTGVPQAGCDALPACLENCDTTDTQCMLDCEGLGADCRLCAAQGSLQCAQDACLPELIGVGACLRSCVLSYALVGGSFDRCMATECPDTWPAARECVSGVVDAGDCTESLAACGVTL